MPTDSYSRATELLHSCTTAHGFLASVTDTANYRRVWSRDGVIVGLAGLLANDPILVEGLRNTLKTLMAAQGESGQIPSNVRISESHEIVEVSYGGMVGRVDPTLWFLIGIANYTHFTGDRSLLEGWSKRIEHSLNLLVAWEFNGKGLLYCPMSSDWADEHIFHGYVLCSQLLRLWAFRALGRITENISLINRARELAGLITVNYWPKREFTTDRRVRHVQAFMDRLSAGKERPYWLPSFSPAGYTTEFDVLSNGLAILLRLGSSEARSAVTAFGENLRAGLPYTLPPAFWPPIESENARYEELRLNFAEQFRNRPHEYHNGGLWPMLAGWWGYALVVEGKDAEAAQLLKALNQFNDKGRGADDTGEFFEYASAATGEPMGTRHCAWSAAASLIISQALAGRRLYLGDLPEPGKKELQDTAFITSDIVQHEVVVEADQPQRAEALYTALFSELKPRSVLSIAGPSGCGKSGISALLASMFARGGREVYVLSCDNYAHREPRENENFRRTVYEKEGRSGLERYLGTQEEMDFKRIENIIEAFKRGSPSALLRIMNIPQSVLEDDARAIDFSKVTLLIVEGTWSVMLKNADYRIYLECSEEIARKNRQQRSRDPQSEFHEMILDIEFEKVSQLRSRSNVVLYPNCSIEKHSLQSIP